MSPLSVIITIAAYFAILVHSILHCRQKSRQCRFLRGQPQIVLVCGGICYDWLQHIRSNVCIRARHGCRK